MTDEMTQEENAQPEISAEELVAAYNNLLGENNKLRKMIDEMAIKVARHTVEVTERDVVIDTLRGMLTPEQGSVADTAISEAMLSLIHI